MEMTHDNEVTQSDPEEAQSHRNCPFVFLRKRYMVAMLSFLGFANIYAMRVNLSVAIAVMVANQTVAQNGEEIQVLSNVCCPPIVLKTGDFSTHTPLLGVSQIYTEHTFCFTLNCNRLPAKIKPKRKETVPTDVHVYLNNFHKESLYIYTQMKNFTHSQIWTLLIHKLLSVLQNNWYGIYNKRFTTRH